MTAVRRPGGEWQIVPQLTASAFAVVFPHSEGRYRSNNQNLCVFR